jgi:hypothetical protein
MIEVTILNDGYASRIRASAITLTAVVAIHHVYEAQRYNDAPKLIALPFAAMLLAVTLAALYGYARKQSRAAYWLLNVVTILGWLGLVGVYISGYNYVAKDILYVAQLVPPESLSALFPHEHLPPTDVFHEGSGVLIFVAAVWFGVEWSRMVRGRGAPDRSRRPLIAGSMD